MWIPSQWVPVLPWNLKRVRKSHYLWLYRSVNFYYFEFLFWGRKEMEPDISTDLETGRGLPFYSKQIRNLVYAFNCCSRFFFFPLSKLCLNDTTASIFLGIFFLAAPSCYYMTGDILSLSQINLALHVKIISMIIMLRFLWSFMANSPQQGYLWDHLSKVHVFHFMWNQCFLAYNVLG